MLGVDHVFPLDDSGTDPQSGSMKKGGGLQVDPALSGDRDVGQLVAHDENVGLNVWPFCPFI